jgi:predicted ATPase
MVMEHLSPVFFDRGIPDLIGYCHLIHTDVPDYLQHAVRIYRYNPLVFIAPPWQDIYQHDSERKQGWEEAVDTYTNIAAAYVAAGYQLLEIPKASVAERANFILEHI